MSDTEFWEKANNIVRLAILSYEKNIQQRLAYKGLNGNKNPINLPKGLGKTGTVWGWRDS